MCTCEIRSHIEGMKSRYAQTVIVGWAVSLKRREVTAQVTCKGQPVQGLCVEWIERPDILSAFFGVQEQMGGPESQNEESKALQAPFGFRISFPSTPEEAYRLAFSVKGDKGRRQVYTIKGGQAEPAGIEGVKSRLKRSVKRLSGRGGNRCDDRRRRDVESGKGQSGRRMRNAEPGKEQGGQEHAEEQDPLISIIVPVYRPEPEHFMEMVRSVMEQTYGKWQLCLADGSEDAEGAEGTGDCADLKAAGGLEDTAGSAGNSGSPGGGQKAAGSLEQLAREISGGDERVVYRKLEQNLGIAGNTNQALALAEGQWIAMLDHDDLLEPEALAEAVRLLRKEPKAGFIYTDSDLADADGIKYYNALLKPDWSPEMLYSANYITHFSMIRKDIIEAVGGFDPQMDGAQDWDIFFKASERAEVICHIPKVLYHWRVARTSTASSVETKPYAPDAQLRAINAHLERMGYEARAFFQDRERYLIRVGWSREIRWRLLRFTEGCGVGQAETQAKPQQMQIQGEGQTQKQAGGQAQKPTGEVPVYIIDFGTAKPVSEETYRELAQWAVCGSIGLVFPKLLDQDGRIVSAGITAEDGHREVLYAGCDDHMADQLGNTDWYRNVRTQLPSLFAVSVENWEKFGAMDTADGEASLTEYARRLSEGGLRHLMNPFARAVMKTESSVRHGSTV